MPASRVAAGDGPGIGASVSASAAAAAESNIPLPDLPPTLMDPIDDVGPLVW
jgi:hypothetical protein